MTFYKTHDTWYISNKFTSKFILTFWLTQKPNRAEEKRKEEKIREKVCRTKKSSEKFRTTNGLLKKEIDKHGYYCQHCKHVDSRASTACRSWYITGFAQAHMNSIDWCCIDDRPWKIRLLSKFIILAYQKQHELYWFESIHLKICCDLHFFMYTTFRRTTWIWGFSILHSSSFHYTQVLK